MYRADDAVICVHNSLRYPLLEIGVPPRMIKHTNLTDVDRLLSLAERDGNCDAIIISERSLEHNAKAGSNTCDLQPLEGIILVLSVVIPMSGSAGSRGDELLRMTNRMIEGYVFRSIVQEIRGGSNFDDTDGCFYSKERINAVPPLGFLLPASVAVVLGCIAFVVACSERKSRDVFDEESLPLIIGNCSGVQTTEEVAKVEATKSNNSNESNDNVKDDDSTLENEPRPSIVSSRDASQDNNESLSGTSCRYFLESSTFLEVYGALKMSVNDSATLHDAADYTDKGVESKQSLIEYVCKYPELRERTVDCLKNKSSERNHVSLVESIVTRKRSEQDSQVGRCKY